MKNKIITFIIGVLVGAIIGVAGCFIYNKVTMGQRGERPDGGNRQEMMEKGERPDFDSNEIPEKPADGNSVPNDSSNETTESNS